MDCVKSIFLWYYTAPLCSCTEQHLLSVSCVWWDLLSCIFFNKQHSHKLNRHTASRRHVRLWFEFIVWQYKLDLVEFIDFPRERSWRRAQQRRQSHHWGRNVWSQSKIDQILVSSILISFLSVWKCGVLSWFHVGTTTPLLRFIAKLWLLFLRLKWTVIKRACTYRCHSVLMCCDNCKALSSTLCIRKSTDTSYSFRHPSPPIKQTMIKGR